MRMQLFLVRATGVIAAFVVSVSLLAGLLKDTQRTDTFGSSARHIVVDNDASDVANWTPAGTSANN